MRYGKILKDSAMRRQISGSSAFSLVEITIAMGITTFAVVAILGLLPVGLTSMGASKKEFTVAQIKQGVESDLAITPYGTNPPTSYFDCDGVPLPSSVGAYYTVTFPTSGAPSFPGSTVSTSMTNSLREVTMLISPQYASASAIMTNTVHQLNVGR